MSTQQSPALPYTRSRREFLRLCLLMPTPFVLAACAGSTTPPTTVPAPTAAPAPTDPPAPTAAPAPTDPPQALALTPACDDDDDVTPAQTEGPYYTPNTPEKANFREAGMAGTPMVLTGIVLTQDCQPVARALVDLWHADDAGVYDNEGYRLRGHVFSDDQGVYRFETIVPGLYPGRTRHFHVKIQAPNGPILTTQFYFPDEPGNANDGIFRPELILDLQDASDGSKIGRFDPVIAI